MLREPNELLKIETTKGGSGRGRSYFENVVDFICFMGELFINERRPQQAFAVCWN